MARLHLPEPLNGEPISSTAASLGGPASRRPREGDVFDVLKSDLARKQLEGGGPNRLAFCTSRRRRRADRWRSGIEWSRNAWISLCAMSFFHGLLLLVASGISERERKAPTS